MLFPVFISRVEELFFSYYYYYYYYCYYYYFFFQIRVAVGSGEGGYCSCYGHVGIDGYQIFIYQITDALFLYLLLFGVDERAKKKRKVAGGQKKNMKKVF